ncbi:MAG: tetratricopeptide repeat protein [Magnetococcales bacterium]|nr:tetratricopeptide repeat protein [Magnetococcales bacterium]
MIAPQPKRKIDDLHDQMIPLMVERDLGRIELPLKRIEMEALKILRSAASGHDEIAIGHLLLAGIAAKRMRREEAREHCANAIRFAPNDPGIRYNIGVTLRTVGDYGEAIAAMEQCHRWNGIDPAPLRELGILCHHTCRYQACAVWLEKLQALTPDDFYPLSEEVNRFADFTRRMNLTDEDVSRVMEAALEAARPFADRLTIESDLFDGEPEHSFMKFNFLLDVDEDKVNVVSNDYYERAALLDPPSVAEWYMLITFSGKRRDASAGDGES